MTEVYTPELCTKYLNTLRLKYPTHDAHLLEIAVLQYFFIDCDKNYKPDPNNEDYLKAKQKYAENEFKGVLLDGEYEPFLKDDCNQDKSL